MVSGIHWASSLTGKGALLYFDVQYITKLTIILYLSSQNYFLSLIYYNTSPCEDTHSTPFESSHRKIDFLLLKKLLSHFLYWGVCILLSDRYWDFLVCPEINFLYVSWPCTRVPTAHCYSYITLSNYEHRLRKTCWRNHKSKSIIVFIFSGKTPIPFSWATNTPLNELSFNLSNLRHLFIHAFNKYLMSVYYILDALKWPKRGIVTYVVSTPHLHETYILVMHTHTG